MAGRRPSITSKVPKFIQLLLADPDMNASAAARGAGYSVKSAGRTAAALMQKPAVREAIQKEMDRRAKKLNIKAENVLSEIHNIAMADANELVEHRRHCCRFCWGDDNRYQRTANEFWEYEEDYSKRLVDAKKGQDIGPFDPQGGMGYDKRLDPNPECAECFGDGEQEVFIKDTRNLSPAVRSLFAGIKTTKDGIEIKFHPKHAALDMLGKHLKLFTNVNEHTGPNGGPIELSALSPEERLARIAQLEKKLGNK